jgi:ribonuclease E
MSDHRVERLSEEPETPEGLDVSSQGAAHGERAESARAEPAQAESAAREHEGDDRGEAAAASGDSQERRDGDSAERGADGERRGRRRGRRGGRRRRGRQRDGEGAPAETFGEVPRESTLGPFGQEPETSEHQAEGRREDGNGAERADTSAHEPAAREPETARQSEAPRETERREPVATRELEPAEAAPRAAEPAGAEPHAPEPAPPAAPTEPPAPPKRGWWNLRRG